MQDLRQLLAWTAALTTQGTRRLAVLCGDDNWSVEHACHWQAQLPGDWLWLSDSLPVPDGFSNHVQSAARSLLGQAFRHAVVDARRGLDVQALAIVAGTLKAGSWLLLLAPPYALWPALPDSNSVRWSDSPVPIATPHFISHLQALIGQDPEVLLWRQGESCRWPPLPGGSPWQPADGRPSPEQAMALCQLLAMDKGVAAVIAPRGRGKSALAGMLIAQLNAPVTVTAPAKAASAVLASYAGRQAHFIAPDRLLDILDAGECPVTHWLVVDEAAAIPVSPLLRLISAFPKVLLTSTVQGYEGTGRGFLLKLCAGLPDLNVLSLNAPLRWAAGCPLERIIDLLLAFDDPRPSHPGKEMNRPERVTSPEPSQRLPLYRLLASAHYRTSPNDLRRLLDAPGQILWRVGSVQAPLGALWAVDEGGLSASLSRAVWAGRRRPRGNLVAQSLAAHGGSPLAATLHGRRVTRVAVLPSCQRQNIGSGLVTDLKADSMNIDYLSVSFGYTAELHRFWQRVGFQIVRIGTCREASSGCYTAMALMAISNAGKALVSHESARFTRSLAWFLPHMTLDWPDIPFKEYVLNDDDWLELAGFAFALRPLEACIACLGRLLLATNQPLTALRGALEHCIDRHTLCQQLGLSGRNALLAAQRAACAEGLAALDPEKTRQLQHRVWKWHEVK